MNNKRRKRIERAIAKGKPIARLVRRLRNIRFMPDAQEALHRELTGRK